MALEDLQGCSLLLLDYEKQILKYHTSSAIRSQRDRRAIYRVRMTRGEEARTGAGRYRVWPRTDNISLVLTYEMLSPLLRKDTRNTSI